MDKTDLKALTRRYLIWLYKTTKEAFDRYERKFAQLDIDKFILEEIEEEIKDSYMPSEKKELEKLVEDLRNYILQKETDCQKLRFENKKTNPEFIFLDLKLEAVEKAIVKELGKDGLNEIKQMYEQEMITRIIKGAEQK